MHTTVTRLRSMMSEIIGQVRHTGERCIIEKNGKPAAALVSIEDLELLEELEDARDLRILAERESEETVSLDEVEEMLERANV